jgi:selenophosphate synthetase-related protein
VLDLAAIPRPAGVEEEAWLTCFPSFGFLLAVAPEHGQALRTQLAPHPELLAAPIGSFAAGPPEVLLARDGERQVLWDGREALTGF